MKQILTTVQIGAKGEQGILEEYTKVQKRT